MNNNIYFRLSKNAFIRIFDDYGYITNQLNRHDRVYDEIGSVFLSALSRKMQTFDEILKKIKTSFEDAVITEIKKDLTDFLSSLEKDQYIVSGYNEADIKEKDKTFSYQDNPKTISYNFLDNPDDKQSYTDSTNILTAKHNQIPQIHACQIEVTNRCNERCIHCYIPHQDKNQILPIDVVDSSLKQLSKEMHTIALTITGGDPFMHPDIEKILTLAREYDFSFCILSNLTLIKPKHIKLLQELDVAHIQTSLYSVIPEEHDHITQLPGSCEKTKAVIEQLIAANIPVQIACPTMHTNYRSYKKVLEYAHERNCKASTDFIMMGRSDYTTDNLQERLSLEETDELLHDIMKYDPDYVKSITSDAFEPHRNPNWANEPICGIARDSLHIAATGDVFPCSGWTKMSCGNVKDQPIKDIWEKSPTILKLRKLKKGDFTQCGGCDYQTFCSICPARNASETNGDYMKPSKHHCDVVALNYKIAQEVFSNRNKT
ncbi:MAG: radical SAM protein [Fibrobacter sp.]|nr:radical SAM protein [Fibrobacter sp.]